MDKKQMISELEAILFAAGDPVPAVRIARILGVDAETVLGLSRELGEYYENELRGIRLLRLDDKLQLCSAPEYSQDITLILEQRRPPRLSQSALEVLAITAYYQPVTRAYIDQVRGVDSAYTVGVLLERGLIEPCGRLEVPGRPTIYKTGETFLRTMGIASLEELPELPDMTTDEGVVALQNKIDALRAGELEGQMSLNDE
jgi:segregation and condensation protein B